MGNKSLAYMPHIDGLRAVAVLGVILYHLDVQLFGGGFLGVDVFFVISGYLITRLIHTEVVQGEFSVSAFYARRARRILPALAVVVIVSSVIACSVYHAQELAGFAKSAIASMLFSGNVFFYATSDYFSANATDLPLLHLWSLGIEEQFYIFFPLLILALRRTLRWLPFTIAGLIVMSVLLSQWMLGKNPSAAFYLLPFRAFELLIGCLIALPGRPALRTGPLSDTALVLGVAGIAYGLVGLTARLPFPGFLALLPCLGTALVLIAGERASRVKSALLEAGPLRYLGKLSYSLYLIHWPTIAFGKRLFPFAGPTEFALGVCGVTLMLSILSYHFVERYFREPQRRKGPRPVLAASSVVIVTIVLFQGLILIKGGLLENPDIRVAKALAYLNYDSKPVYRSRECFLVADQDPFTTDVSTCLPSGEAKRALLWGDSHVAQFYAGLKDPFNTQGYSLGMLTAQSCPPVEGWVEATNPQCTAFNEMALARIAEYRPDLIVMSAHWRLDDQTTRLFEATLEKLKATGTRLVIVGESPLYKQNVPNIIADRIKNDDASFMASRELDTAFLDNAERTLSHLATAHGIRFVSLMKLMCPSGACPLLADDGTPAHFDIAHLTASGSMMFGRRLAPALLQ